MTAATVYGICSKAFHRAVANVITKAILPIQKDFEEHQLEDNRRFAEVEHARDQYHMENTALLEKHTEELDGIKKAQLRMEAMLNELSKQVGTLMRKAAPKHK